MKQSRLKAGCRIIGIDPGLASTGWGVLDCSGGKIKYIDHGNIETKAGAPRAERLFIIMKCFRSILDDYKPGKAAIETLYFGRNVSSAIPVAEARGIISAILAERGIPILELTPNAIKKGVVGLVKADKMQIQQMVKLILGLDEIPKPDHAADALGAAICVALNLKNGIIGYDKQP
ncbi:MAG: crossover junction endodeoxyribonuclease RuvC [Treponema sp.]|nr:crossover junction endodeoxyribonuclease RuvC [Treponema sp.]